MIRRDSSSIVYEDVNKKMFKGIPEGQLPPHLARARDYTVTKEDNLTRPVYTRVSPFVTNLINNRHRFTRPTSATIKCLTSSERIQDLNAAWMILIENAERIYEEFKGQHNFDIGDLILGSCLKPRCCIALKPISLCCLQ